MVMRRVILEKHNPLWETQYRREISLFREFLSGELLAAYHIGSTAIPAIRAKPVIDILLVVKSIQKLDDYNRRFEEIGYEAKGEFGIKGRRFFQKGGDARTHHVHVFETGDPQISRHVRFRDYLLANAQAARDYEKLKMQLAGQYKRDADAYVRGKAEFIGVIDNVCRNLES